MRILLQLYTALCFFTSTMVVFACKRRVIRSHYYDAYLSFLFRQQIERILYCVQMYNKL